MFESIQSTIFREFANRATQLAQHTLTKYHLWLLNNRKDSDIPLNGLMSFILFFFHIQRMILSYVFETILMFFLFLVFYFLQRKQHYRLGVSRTIQASAETLLITLSSDAEFQLDGNVFEKNRLNRIMIQGRGPDFGQEHVEISANAFNGNAGPFPEIEILNVHTVILHSNAFYCTYNGSVFVFSNINILYTFT